MLTRRLNYTFLILALLFVFPVFGTSGDWDDHGKCSLRTLKGSFGVFEQGSVVAQLQGLPAPPYAMAIVALNIYDGKGNLSGSYTASYGGLTESGTLAGTYTVNPDCTYSDQITLAPSGTTLHRAGNISGDSGSRKISFIYVGPDMYAFEAPFVASGTAKATAPGGCSARMLKGGWAAVAQATNTVDMYTPPWFTAPYWMNSTILFTMDSNGAFAGSGSLNWMGMRMPLDVSGTFTVNHDCTCLVLESDTYGVGHRAGVITGIGPDLEIQLLFTDPGAVAFLTAVKQ